MIEAIPNVSNLVEVSQRVEELRKSPRMQYRFQQDIAPIHGGQLPRKSDFYRVSCVDISCGGLCFVTADKPDFESLVVALGPQKVPMYVVAKVTNVATISAVNGEFFRIGCQFTERVYL